MNNTGWRGWMRGLTLGGVFALGLGGGLIAGLSDGLGVGPARALGQDDITLKRGVGEITPEDREPSGPSPPVLAYLIAIGCLIAVVGVLCYPNRKDI